MTNLALCITQRYVTIFVSKQSMLFSISAFVASNNLLLNGTQQISTRKHANVTACGQCKTNLVGIYIGQKVLFQNWIERIVCKVVLQTQVFWRALTVHLCLLYYTF